MVQSEEASSTAGGGNALITPEALWVPSTPAEMGDSTSSSPPPAAADR